MYFVTLLSPMSMPRFKQLAGNAGCTTVGFSCDILRIRSQVSRTIAGRPGCPRRTFQVQNISRGTGYFLAWSPGLFTVIEIFESLIDSAMKFLTGPGKDL